MFFPNITSSQTKQYKTEMVNFNLIFISFFQKYSIYFRKSGTNLSHSKVQIYTLYTLLCDDYYIALLCYNKNENKASNGMHEKVDNICSENMFIKLYFSSTQLTYKLYSIDAGRLGANTLTNQFQYSSRRLYQYNEDNFLFKF